MTRQPGPDGPPQQQPEDGAASGGTASSDWRGKAVLVGAGVIGAVVLVVVIVLIVMAALGVGFFASKSDDAAGGSAAGSSVTAAPAAPAGGTPVCIFDASAVQDLASSMSGWLSSSGYVVTRTGSLPASSVPRNTVYFTGELEPEGRALARLIGAEAQARPTTFTECPRQLVLIVRTS